MKTIKFTDVELRVISVLLDSNPCNCGCAFNEMDDNDIDCDECPLEKAKESIQSKLGLI